MLLHGQVDKVQDEARKAMKFWTILHFLLQVDAQRDEARKAYRDDQQSKEKQEVWKGRVIALKAAQANLRTAREAYYKCGISFGRLGSTYSSTPAGAAPMLARMPELQRGLAQGDPGLGRWQISHISCLTSSCVVTRGAVLQRM